MKYSIQKSRHSSVKFTYEKGVKAYRSTPVELEFWLRIQELETALKDISTMPQYDQDDAHRLRNLAKRALNNK